MKTMLQTHGPDFKYYKFALITISGSSSYRLPSALFRCRSTANTSDPSYCWSHLDHRYGLRIRHFRIQRLIIVTMQWSLGSITLESSANAIKDLNRWSFKSNGSMEFQQLNLLRLHPLVNWISVWYIYIYIYINGLFNSVSYICIEGFKSWLHACV